MYATTGGPSRKSLYIQQEMVFLFELKTSEVKLIAMEEAEKLIEKRTKKITEMVKYANRLYDPEEAVNALCCKLLDNKAELEIRMLLGICYFMQGNMQSARMVFSNLVRDYPKEEEKA